MCWNTVPLLLAGRFEYKLSATAEPKTQAMAVVGEIPSPCVAATMAGLETKPDGRGRVVRFRYIMTAAPLDADVHRHAFEGST